MKPNEIKALLFEETAKKGDIVRVKGEDWVVAWVDAKVHIMKTAGSLVSRAVSKSHLEPRKGYWKLV